jgi:CP family cyanate transporter-like MFS transporter
MRLTILSVPPVIPLIREELRMNETQVGLLMGLPLLTFALAAVPGSLMIARLGAVPTMSGALLLVAAAAAARAAASDVLLLFAATLVMGAGVALMHPGIPTLVRAWLPRRIGLATAVASNGILVGVTLGPVLTIPLVLPMVSGSWRASLLVWAVPVLAIALAFLAFAPRTAAPQAEAAAAADARRWWPSFRSPLVWLLGLTFGSNNALFFGMNGFLPDYLVGIGRGDLIGMALGAMSGSQIVASILLLGGADHLQRRAWPFLVFGPLALAGVAGLLVADGYWIVLAAVLVGLGLAVTFVLTLALPALLSPLEEVHRLSAGMFTISYAYAVVIPVVCGALWDLTGGPLPAFALLATCPVTLTVVGAALSMAARRSRPPPVPG